MRTKYTPLTEAQWLHHCQQGGFTVYRGERFQRGAGLGNVLKGLFRMIWPMAKSAGKAIANQAMHTGKELLTDLATGENVSSALEKHGRAALGSLVEKGGKRLAHKIQTGEGLGNRKSINRKRRRRKDALGMIR